MKQDVSLFLRIRSSNGAWVYARAAVASNGRLKQLCATVNGKPENHPEGVYNLRYWMGATRKWEPVGSDPSLAQVALQRKILELQAAGLGMALPTLPEVAVPAHPASEPSTEPEKAQKSLAELVTGYLSEINEHKSHKTWLAYRVTLILFAEFLTKTWLTFKQHRSERPQSTTVAVLRADFFLPFAVIAKEISEPTCLFIKGEPEKSQIAMGQRRVLVALRKGGFIQQVVTMRARALSSVVYPSMQLGKEKMACCNMPVSSVMLDK